MEGNIGYAVITTREYKELIEDNMNKANCVKELNEEAFKRNNINDKLEKYFFDRLIDEERYHFENMKKCNPTDYHYQEIYKCFLEVGIEDVQYIHTSIMTMKHHFNNPELLEKGE